MWYSVTERYLPNTYNAAFWCHLSFISYLLEPVHKVCINEWTYAYAGSIIYLVMGRVVFSII